MWTVSVWDDRDTDSDEPESSLGDFFTEKEAEAALTYYLSSNHGPHIYRFRVWRRGKESND